MHSSFICSSCGNTLYEQFSQTQVRCLNCGYVSEYDTGFKVKKEFELTNESGLLDLIEKQTYVTAPMSKRFINYIIDITCIIFIIILIMMLIHSMGYTLIMSENELIQILFLITFPFYYALLEYKFGKTIGKFFTRTKVVSSDGTELSFGQCLIRSFCRIIPFEYVSGLFTSGIFWHDSIPKTLVVED